MRSRLFSVLSLVACVIAFAVPLESTAQPVPASTEAYAVLVVPDVADLRRAELEAISAFAESLRESLSGGR